MNDGKISYADYHGFLKSRSEFIIERKPSSSISTFTWHKSQLNAFFSIKVSKTSLGVSTMSSIKNILEIGHNKNVLSTLKLTRKEELIR